MSRQFATNVTTIYDIFCPVPFLPSPFGFRRTNTPKLVRPRWGQPPFDPTQTGLCKFGWVWSSLKNSSWRATPFSPPLAFCKIMREEEKDVVGIAWRGSITLPQSFAMSLTSFPKSLFIFRPCPGCRLSGPVLRDTARLSQRYPPIARYGVFGASIWPIGCDTPSPVFGRFPLGEYAKWRCDTPPPSEGVSQRYLRDTL